MKKRKTISENKKKIVGNLEKLSSKKTILVVSIKNIPASQFQEITKKLRGKAIVKVPRKNLIILAIERKKELEKLKQNIQKEEGFAFLFSDLDAYDLAGELIKNKTSTRAKAGQESPIDIEIPEGPTDLVPGPAISELGALGIEIQIEKGKINIKKSKIIVKKGDKIKQNAADLMSKLNIKPFSVGFTLLFAFDNEKKIFYNEISINPEETIKNILERYLKSLAFAIEINYLSKDTIKHFIFKALIHSNKINRIFIGEPETITEIIKDQQQEIKEEKKEESKVDSTVGLASLFG
jgi:ribosomal protein L10